MARPAEVGLARQGRRDMAERNPREVRFAPGSDPVPPDLQIPDPPSDSADWMTQEPQGYPEPLFEDPADDQEATNG